MIEHSILAFLALVAVAAISFEIYRYIKGHPQALASLEARVAALEASGKQDLAGLISSFNRLRDKLEGISSTPSGSISTPSGGGAPAAGGGAPSGTNANPPPAPMPAPTPPASANDGFALVANDRPLRNTVTKDERLVYTFSNVGFTTIQIQVMGSPGKFFTQAVFSVVNRAGTVVVSQQVNNVSGDGPLNIPATLPQDNYMLVLQVDGSGTLAVQYLAWA